MIISAIIGFLSLFFDVVYWAKWASSYLVLKLHKRYVKRRFDLYDFSEGSSYEQLAVVPPKEEKILESPMPESHIAQAGDEVFFYGVNSKSECLVMRIARGCSQVAEAWIYLKLEDGRCFHLQDTSGFQRTYGDKVTSFSCGGLQAQYLSAMRRWRIHYCGMLREVTSKKEDEHSQVFVKFAFQWTASSDVYDPTSDLEVNATAKAMARVKWDMPLPPLKKIHDVLDMYCQSGVITGTVTVQNESKYELYLIGERIRFLGKVSDCAGSKFKYLLGSTPKNGLIVHVAKASISNAAENLYFGFIVHPDGEMRYLEDIDSRKNLSERNHPGLTDMDITFKAEKYYHLTGKLNRHEAVSFHAKQLWQGQLEAHFIEFEIGGFKGRGLVMIGEVYGMSMEKIVMSIPQEIPSVSPMAVYFSDRISQLSEITGGKGSSLGKLTELSSHLKTFIVPKGIVVTTAAYYEFLTPELHGKIAKMTDVVYGNVSGEVKKACKSVSDALEKSLLPNKIAKEIEQKLNILFDGKINNYKFAVRSSATGEDTDQMSAAGQMDTFLGVRGLKEIFTAVKKCWASQFGTIAIQYKRQNGQLLNSPMAVVIQQMVDCQAAGVLFTCDPVTSDPSVIAITGNYGLGESVVSGSEEPDTIILDKSHTGVLNVRSVLVGSKQHKIVQDSREDGGTTVTDVPEDERNQCCISNEIALDLGNLSLKIEDFYKSPRDIEWGVKDGEIYILQSRPVTTGAETTDYEIMHEFDTPLRCESEFFSKCNVGEVLPGATSPLGIDVLANYFRIAFRTKMLSDRQVNNAFKTIYFPTGCVFFYNHGHMSMIDLLGRMDDLTSVMAQSFMIGVFGRILDEPELYETVKYKEWKNNTSIRDTLKFLWSIFFSGRGIEALQEQLYSFRFPENGKSSDKVFDIQMQHCDMMKEAMVRHMICSENSSFWNMKLFVLLSKAKGRVDTDVYSDFAKLMSTMSNVESADVPNGMQSLAQYIVKEKTSEEFKAMSVEDALEWLETTSSDAGLKYREFIKRHGHRCLKEFDVHSKTWENDPKPLIKLLQNMSASCENTKNKNEDSFSKTVSNLQIPVGLKTKWTLRFMLPNCQRGVREREFCKSNLIKSVDNVRVGFQHLSKAMVAEGYVPDDDLIFFMTIDEIQELIKNRNPKIISRANHRRKLFPQLETLRFEEISKGRPEPINMKNENEEITYDADLIMKGVPVSQGIVKGYARVALNLEEAADLKPGEILITYSTDIGWSPFFPMLGGVVTEIGGLISHGSVVSREYGIPCVVGLRNATRMFNTGDYVILDGSKGILQRIPQPEI